MRSLLFILSTLFCIAIPAQEKRPDLNALYAEIDKAIEQSPHYVAKFEKEVEEKKSLYRQTTEPDYKLMNCMEVYDLYSTFKNDSALKYIRECILLADSLGYDDMAGQARAKMAFQCGKSGMYVEAGELLREIDRERLSQEGLVVYYNALMHLYEDVGTYTGLRYKRNDYYAVRDRYRDSLLQVVSESSDTYMNFQLTALLNEGKIEEAMRVSNKWINHVNMGTRADAMASFFRHSVYLAKGDKEMALYWLGKAALADIRQATMDQGALIALANLLTQDGEEDRSYRYLKFTWECNTFFDPGMRSAVINPVMGALDRNHQSILDRHTRFLLYAAAGFTLLSMLLLAMFYYVLRQKKKLARAQQEALASNEQLRQSNEKLQWMNEWMKKSNKELFDINHKLEAERQQMLKDSMPNKQ